MVFGRLNNLFENPGVDQIRGGNPTFYADLFEDACVDQKDDDLKINLDQF